MASLRDEKAKKVLVIFAHPDDAEFTAGGTLAKWALAGDQIYYVVCTDGSKGSKEKELSAEQLTALRQQEQREAAQVLGVSDVLFLDWADGELTNSKELRAEFTRLIRSLRPDILLTWDPWRPYQLHSDHRAAGQAALDAVMAATNPRYFPEQLRGALKPHQVEEVYLFGTDNPDCWVDITETFPTKIKAIAQHTSQMTSIDDLEEQIGAWNRTLGEPEGFTFAEAFKVLRPHCEICR